MWWREIASFPDTAGNIFIPFEPSSRLPLWYARPTPLLRAALY